VGACRGAAVQPDGRRIDDTRSDHLYLRAGGRLRREVIAALRTRRTPHRDPACALRGSLTRAQGAEMAAHRAPAVATDMPVYVGDPAGPGQRGRNENTDGHLRQHVPEGTGRSMHGPGDLEHVAAQLIGRSRGTAGG
jgi:IS30 family transposase